MQADGGRHDQLWLEEARESLQLHWASLLRYAIINACSLNIQKAEAGVS